MHARGVARPVGRAALLLGLAAALLLHACAGGRRSGTSADRSVLTREEIVSRQFENAFDAISSMRASWLLDRGTDSFASPSRVQVYIDNVRLGEIETLRSIPVNTVWLIRHYDALQASARFGVGHGAGVIQIDTHASVPAP